MLPTEFPRMQTPWFCPWGVKGQMGAGIGVGAPVEESNFPTLGESNYLNIFDKCNSVN